ncbi:MAG: pyrroline-5-carboxylate reductase [Clostridia bacterium]|nr:pyrroline-5-carboxylate reductase [Clostridia bacterium]
MYQLGFIGCGNMGGALVRAAVKSVGGANIAVCDFDQTKANTLQKECGVFATDAATLAENCKFVVLGVKPQNLQETLQSIATPLANHKDVVVITMAAGASIASIRAFSGLNLPVIRIMPNTPVLVEKGMILYCTSNVSKQDENAFLAAFAKAGVLDKIPEEKIDAASALSGCGPAYVYAFAEALADGAVECGVPRDKAALYTAQTLLGAAEMLLTYGHPGDLKDAVCSPGGTTIAGIHALEKAGMRNAAMDAVAAAYKRTLELKK